MLTLIESRGGYNIYSKVTNFKNHLCQFEVQKAGRIVSSGYHRLTEAQSRVDRLVDADKKAKEILLHSIKPVNKKNFKIVKKEVV